MKFSCLCLIFCLTAISGRAQNYTSWFTGNTVDSLASPSGGVCLMGGATEDDNAMRWFLQRANGGDVLVLRTSGSNGYNDYLYSQLGVQVNSVETIRCNDATASYDVYVLNRIEKAEAIWFAGGNQWTYINYWRNTPVERWINKAILERKIVVGGTSAGMAIQGKYYFSARNGTVTSPAALTNPFSNLVTVDSSSFLKNAFLDQTITDTHFDNPDRRGRLIAFLARIHSDYGRFANAVACDEYTAVCIDTSGQARVFGRFPSQDDNAWFVQANCGQMLPEPESCVAGSPLTWNRGGQALIVYQIKGNAAGSKFFDLSDWKTGSGGDWLHWSVENGNFASQAGIPPDCHPLEVKIPEQSQEIFFGPNPAEDRLQIGFSGIAADKIAFRIYNHLGIGYYPIHSALHGLLEIETEKFPSGLYIIELAEPKGRVVRRKFIKK